MAKYTEDQAVEGLFMATLLQDIPSIGFFEGYLSGMRGEEAPPKGAQFADYEMHKNAGTMPDPLYDDEQTREVALTIGYEAALEDR